MKNISLFFICMLFLSSCEDTSWLDKEPTNILGNDQVWSDPALVDGVLANLYDRMPVDEFNNRGYAGDMFKAEFNMLIANEAMWSGDRNGLNGVEEISKTYYQYWDYVFIREINLFIEKAQASNLVKKKIFEAEARFIRAFTYFEMVKRMGGVPLVTKSYEYSASTPIEDYQIPRSKESEIYDFISDEIDVIVSLYENNDDLNSRRVTKWAALALKSRAMLYAGSLAKYNNSMGSPVTLPNGEVGISSSKASEYYTKSWEASLAIISSKKFKLASDYYQLFDKKDGNEMILVKDYIESEYSHQFTLRSTTPSSAKASYGGAYVTPMLETVNSYQKLDGTDGAIVNENVDGSPIYFDNITTPFEGRDKRLEATILYPGSDFKGKTTSILAGMIVKHPDGTIDTTTSMTLGDQDLKGNLLRGADGPSNDRFVTNSGFYMKKFISSKGDAALAGTGADNVWPIFRYGEILLNAAEAGLELNKADAKNYINEVRERAGFGANSLSQLDFDDIIHERKVELVYEGHRYFDIKRWRIAESVLGGVQFHGLFPYSYIDSTANPVTKKYVFEKIAPEMLKNKLFDRANYYTFIPSGAIANNPKLVENPGQ